MLEGNTECWICKRTESEIVTEIKGRKWAESIFRLLKHANPRLFKGGIQHTPGIGSYIYEETGSLIYSWSL